MSIRRSIHHSLRKGLLSILFLLLSFQSLANVDCKNQWGKVQVKSASPCVISLVASEEPSSLLVNGAQWNPHKETFSLKMKLKNPETLTGLKVTFYTRGEPTASWTLPLYTDPEYNLLQNDFPAWVSIPFGDLEWLTKKNLPELTFDGMSIYFATKPTGVPLELEIEKVKRTSKPNKGKVSITFDDGYLTNYTAAEIMAPFKLRGTAYIIPKAIGLKGHLKEEHLIKMKEMGWSLSAHLTTPVTQIKDLDGVIKEAKAYVTKWGSAKTADHFALPLGKYNPSVLSTLKNYFKTIRLAGGHTQTLPVQDQYRLKTINVISNMSPEDVYKKCVAALNNGEWAILMFHYLDDPSKGALNYSSSNYKKLMELLAKHRGDVLPVDEVF